MADKSDFTDAEWKAVAEAPLLVTVTMFAAGQHGPISMIKESAAGARVIHVDVDHGLAAHFAAFLALLEANEEGPARHDPRDVPGIPAITIEIQVLVLGKAQQGHRGVLPCIRVLAEEDRVFALYVGVFGREGHDDPDVVAVLRARARDHPEVLVLNVVQHLVSGHGCLESVST